MEKPSLATPRTEQFTKYRINSIFLVEGIPQAAKQSWQDMSMDYAFPESSRESHAREHWSPLPHYTGHTEPQGTLTLPETDWDCCNSEAS